jgi:hypothetical protein
MRDDQLAGTIECDYSERARKRTGLDPNLIHSLRVSNTSFQYVVHKSRVIQHGLQVEEPAHQLDEFGGSAIPISVREPLKGLLWLSLHKCAQLLSL